MRRTSSDDGRRTRSVRVGILLLNVAALLYLTLDGHQTGVNLMFPGDTFGDPFAEIEDGITWCHGWPVICYVRDSLDTVKINSSSVLIDLDDPQLQFSPFPFDRSPVLAASVVGMFLNLGMAATLLLGLWFALGTIPLPPVRFSIRSMLIATAILSFLLATGLVMSRHLFMIGSYVLLSGSAGLCGWSVFAFARPAVFRSRPRGERRTDADTV